MTDHLTLATLSALADGELSAEQLAAAQQHLSGCNACTSSALYQSLMKSATARAGQRYSVSPQLAGRLARYTSDASGSSGLPQSAGQSILSTRMPRTALYGWTAAAAVLIVFLGSMVIMRHQQQTAIVAAQQATLTAEITDRHITTLASSQPLDVLSSDRHTVKPWFQGKLPFSFNLPENLPPDVHLDGANLTYLRNQPAAQLLYSIGKHRVSVFLEQKSNASSPANSSATLSGFHLIETETDDLQLEAISDVDPARLSELVGLIQHVQANTPVQVR